MRELWHYKITSLKHEFPFLFRDLALTSFSAIDWSLSRKQHIFNPTTPQPLYYARFLPLMRFQVHQSLMNMRRIMNLFTHEHFPSLSIPSLTKPLFTLSNIRFAFNCIFHIWRNFSSLNIPFKVLVMLRADFAATIDL